MNDQALTQESAPSPAGEPTPAAPAPRHWLRTLRDDLRQLVMPVWPLLLIGVGCVMLASQLAGEQVITKYIVEAVSLWVVGIGTLAAALMQGQPWRSLVPQRLQRRDAVIIVGLFALAFAVRLAALNSRFYIMTGDEGSSGLSGLDFLEGRLNNPFRIGWFSFPSLFFVIQAASIGIFGHTNAGLVFPSVLCGALTVIVWYWATQPLLGRLGSLISAGILATNDLHLHFSRIGLNNIWDALFLAAILGLLWRGWDSNQRGYFVLSGLLLGLSQYFYTGTRALILAIGIWCILLLMFYPRRLAQLLPQLVAMGLVALVVFLPLGRYFLKHLDEFAAPLNRVSLLRNDWVPGGGNWFVLQSQVTKQPVWVVVLQNVRDSLLGFVTKPLQHWYQPKHPLLTPIPAVLFVVGLLIALRRLRDPRTWLLYLMLGAVVFGVAITESTPASQRMIAAVPLAVFFVGLALVTLVRGLVRYRPSWRPVGVWLVGGLTAMIMAATVHFYFTDYLPRGMDPNTEIAYGLGQVLASYPPQSELLFFGAPRLVYRGFANIQYLAPQVKGTDVELPLPAAPDLDPQCPHTVFAFVPERQNELALIQARYPAGKLTFFFSRGQLLFLTYDVASGAMSVPAPTS